LTPGREKVLPWLGRSAAIFHPLRQRRGLIADLAQSLFSTAKEGGLLACLLFQSLLGKS